MAKFSYIYSRRGGENVLDEFESSIAFQASSMKFINFYSSRHNFSWQLYISSFKTWFEGNLCLKFKARYGKWKFRKLFLPIFKISCLTSDQSARNKINLPFSVASSEWVLFPWASSRPAPRQRSPSWPRPGWFPSGSGCGSWGLGTGWTGPCSTVPRWPAHEQYAVWAVPRPRKYSSPFIDQAIWRGRKGMFTQKYFDIVLFLNCWKKDEK